jgi:hypothetical protein
MLMILIMMIIVMMMMMVTDDGHNPDQHDNAHVDGDGDDNG